MPRSATTACASCSIRRDRRYRYPFVNCTNCGPRFTITTRLPYDRRNTTMAGFPLCASCRREYGDPTDRRYHAEPLACPVCGPQLRFVTGSGELTGTDAAIAATHRALLDGRIVAVKGIGGYHLACDARDDAAVARLRARKQRPAKAFAVMARDLEVACRLATFDHTAVALLTSTSRPVVLAPRRARRADQRRGRAREPSRRRDAAVHPAAPSALRSDPGARGGTAAGARDDERQPERRTDLLRRRRRPQPPPGHRRRMAAPRPTDPRAVRRLGRARRRGRGATRPPFARSQPRSDHAGARRPTPARGRRRPQERVLPGLADGPRG